MEAAVAVIGGGISFQVTRSVLYWTRYCRPGFEFQWKAAVGPGSRLKRESNSLSSLPGEPWSSVLKRQFVGLLGSPCQLVRTNECPAPIVMFGHGGTSSYWTENNVRLSELRSRMRSPDFDKPPQ